LPAGSIPLSIHDCVSASSAISTDLLREEPARDGYLSPEVHLLGYRAYKRVCHTCCGMYECTQRTGPDLEFT